MEERTSRLPAPIMLLSGHAGALYGVRFSPNGNHLASAGHERAIFLWDLPSCENFNVLRGHKNAITQLEWLDDRTVCTSSADKTVMLWDAHVGKRRRKFSGHAAFVNAVCPARGEASLVSGGDDARALLWDSRTRNAVGTLEVGRAVTAVAFSEANDIVFAGAIDDKIRAFDIRSAGVVFELAHANTITGLALSPDGTSLLSNAMDSRVNVWDVRPMPSSDHRLEATFGGVRHDFHKILLRCAWAPDGRKISAGSADQIVHVWDLAARDELYYLPGHQGSVNDVHFHPTEPIIASASSDTLIYLGELSPYEEEEEEEEEVR
ncbi:hypothetical protein CTAYLR_001348 [Chrysophaeum taylorii]|uniref:Uncharacterized protein n=1 Tax=Chrysophaeum taylorii TaxID=2483200 RepID=A0AAD7XES3_9STRA|nr:hypothetical protein CTAYLR_001348 [Chrysophaeum taylorii]